LDGVDAALVQLSVLGPGIPTVLQQQDTPPPPFAGFSAFALGGSRILFLLTVILGIAGVRVITGLMLGLGPFFIAFVMFDNTRSLFEGWVRVLAGAAFPAIGVSIVLGLELSLLEPWLSTVLAQRIAGQALPSVPTELFVVTGSFAIIALAVLGACVRLAGAFRLAPWISRGEDTRAADPQGATTSPAMITNVQSRDERSRAAMVADVLVAMQRREGVVRAPGMSNQIGLRASDSSGFAARHNERAAVSIGRSLTRRAQNRASASAGRRDAR
jgi:type IV secretion system protein VirB6